MSQGRTKRLGGVSSEKRPGDYVNIVFTGVSSEKRPGDYVNIVFTADTFAPASPHLHYECPTGKDGPHAIVETTGGPYSPNVRVIAVCVTFESARAVARLHGEDISPKVIDCYDEYGIFGYGTAIDYRRITSRHRDT